MAQGDIIISISEVAATSFYVIQPPAGQSWLVDDFFASGNGTSEGYGQHYDGTHYGSAFYTNLIRVHYNSYRATQNKTHQETMFHITNSLYWRVYNMNAAAQKCGLAALQLK